MTELGITLRDQREKKDLSLRELGQLMGLSKQYLAAIEVGEGRASAEICQLLAHHLGLDPDVVLLLAGHVPEDVLELLRENPQAGCALLRRALAMAG
jgi:transcriptional regulator with XRE-family HTH domain